MAGTGDRSGAVMGFMPPRFAPGNQHAGHELWVGQPDARGWPVPSSPCGPVRVFDAARRSGDHNYMATDQAGPVLAGDAARTGDGANASGETASDRGGPDGSGGEGPASSAAGPRGWSDGRGPRRWAAA